MTADVTMAALLEAWPELSEKAGTDWPGLYWQWLDCVRAYLEAADEDGRALAADRALGLIEQAPAEVQQAVKAEMRRLYAASGADRDRGDPQGGPPVRDMLGAARGLAARLSSPSAVIRHTDVHCPTQVQVGKRFAIITGLTRSPADDAQDPQELQAEINKLIKVVLTPRETLEAIGEVSQTLRVEPDRDSPPAVFYLRARQSGPQQILLDFYDSRTLLVSQTLYLDAVSGPVSEVLDKPAGIHLNIGDYLAPHPDLILRVTTLDNRLTYHLHFGDTRMLPVEGDTLRADPRAFRQHVLEEISGLRQGLNVEGAAITSDEVVRGIQRIGQRLYHQLFPEALRREYCRFRGQVRSLQIVSDEPWIPWELIKPYELDGFDGPGFEDDFLCLQFDLSRWIMPGTAPAAEIPVHSIACIAPTDSGLPATASERAFLYWLAADTGATNASPAMAGREQVIAILEGKTPVALWHFACHGSYRDIDPDNSPLHLQDRTTLYPNDLIGPAVEGRLSGDRPLVFLNACRAGSQGLSLTGLGGWANTFVSGCRVGALIAPLWEVSDGPAAAFAKAFYRDARKPGYTLAQALRGARAQLRDANPHDPTWLAYSLYANPNARLRWTKGAFRAG